MACVEETINGMQGEASNEAINAIPASLHDIAPDVVVEEDSSNAEYLKNLAARIFYGWRYDVYEKGSMNSKLVM